jgi:ABC-2 type transport system permease protein
MRNIWTIFKKEFRSYFNSPIAYIVITVFLVLNSWLFFRGFFIFNQADLRSFFALQPWLFLFFVPAITMRLWAEEKRQGTYEILLTFPVRDWEVVFGKFLAGFAFLAIAVFLTLSLPLTVSYLGNPDTGPITGGYVGTLLMGAAYLAIGLFASSITINQIIAFIVGITISFFFLIIGEPIVLFSLPSWLASFFEYLGLGKHFASVGRGVIDTRDIIYYSSLIFFFLLLNTQVISSRKWKKTGAKSNLLQGGNFAAIVSISLGILILVNILSLRHFSRIDLTEQKEFTLSDATKDLVSKLDDLVNINVYFTKDLPPHLMGLSQQVKDILDEYRAYSHGNIQISFIDPAENKELEQRVHILGIPRVQVNIFEKDQAQIKTVYLGIAVSYEDKSEVIPVVQDVMNLEYDLTAATKKVTSEKIPVIGFLTGHKEPSLYKKFRSIRMALEKQYKVREVEIQQGQFIDSDIDTLVIAGSKDVGEWDQFAIDQYLMRGGKVFFMLDHIRFEEGSLNVLPHKSNLEPLLLKYGVRIENSLVKDKLCSNASFSSGFFSYSVPYEFWPKPSTKYFDQKNPALSRLESVVFPWTRPVVVEKSSDNVQVSNLVKSSPYASLEKGNRPNVQPKSSQDIFAHMMGRQKEKDDFHQVNLAVALRGIFPSYFSDRPVPVADKKKEKSVIKPEGKEEKKPEAVKESSETQIVVVGTSRFIEDGFSNRFKGNELFFLNLLDWLNIGEDLISIRSRTVTDRPLQETTESEKTMVKYTNTFGISLLVIFFGLARFMFKKRSRQIYETLAN